MPSLTPYTFPMYLLIAWVCILLVLTAILALTSAFSKDRENFKLVYGYAQGVAGVITIAFFIALYCTAMAMAKTSNSVEDPPPIEETQK